MLGRDTMWDHLILYSRYKYDSIQYNFELNSIEIFISHLTMNNFKKYEHSQYNYNKSYKVMFSCQQAILWIRYINNSTH